MDQVTPDLCDERRTVMDERFKRDKERLEDLERFQQDSGERLLQLEKLSLQLGEMLKRDDERLAKHDASLRDQGQRLGALEKHSIEKMDERIKELESRSGKKWDKLVWLVVSGGVSAAVAAIMPAVFGLLR